MISIFPFSLPSQRREYNQEVVSATKYLHDHVIPALVRSLERGTPPTKDDYTGLSTRISEEFHKVGESVRAQGNGVSLYKLRAEELEQMTCNRSQLMPEREREREREAYPYGWRYPGRLEGKCG